MTTNPLERGRVYYSEYLRLGQLLDQQVRMSERAGTPAHDEMLFIIVHQAYELWFKLILHELDRIQKDFGHDPVADDRLGRIVHGLDRIHEILKLLVHQLDILETMTPLDFLDFRDLLSPASGFQSVQFRLIEIRFGLRSEDRLKFDDRRFDLLLSHDDRQRIAVAEGGEKLIDQLDRWLARTPFVELSGYAFSTAYREAVIRALIADTEQLRATEGMSEAQRAAETKAIAAALERFNAIFAAPSGPSPWRMSFAAIQAALFITVYRDEPVLQLPFRLLAALMDIEEAVALWRYRHSLMVRRMIGVKTGTGGSSGHDYLQQTAERHQIFGDLFQLSSYLIPRSELPALPPELKTRMGFVYAHRPAP
ncbi:MAG: tryptophan 2,3-dioxygenase family protein [Xanthobacteraceae bacterium]